MSIPIRIMMAFSLCPSIHPNGEICQPLFMEARAASHLPMVMLKFTNGRARHQYTRRSILTTASVSCEPSTPLEDLIISGIRTKPAISCIAEAEPVTSDPEFRLEHGPGGIYRSLAGAA